MELEKVCKKLLIKEPFWGLFLLGFNKRVMDNPPHQLETLAVVKKGLSCELLVNKEFWEAHDEVQQEALLLHELHHICFQHLYMAKDFPEDARRNIAADLEVNCYVNNLPKGHLDVKDFGLPERKGLKYYYEHLPECPGGTRAGNSGNGDNDDDNDSNNSKTLDDHSPWKEFSELTEAQQELVKDQINAQLKRAYETVTKQQGNIPGYMEGIIDDILKERPRIYDWKAQFRRALGTEIDLKLKKTYQRESRRFIRNPGVKFKKKVRILVGIDTSGSVSDTELSEFFSEIMHIYKAGASIYVIECDTCISSEWEFTGFRNVKITGRGGTEFGPAIDYYRAHKKEYTSFVFFTDGYAETNHLDVPNNDMTWVITSNGNHENNYPGKVIFIPNREEA